jgi:hypothetical protein
VPTTCIPLAEARARAADAHKRNEERYLAALAKQGLLPIVLPARVVDARRDDGGDAVPRVITRHVDGRRVRVLVSQPNAACDFDPGRLKLARNAKGKLYSVDLRPKVPPPDYLLACGCTEYHFTCGGAAPRPVVAHYTLHPGLDYKGSITIEHAAEPTSVLFTDKQPDGSACPPPPDPPP